MITRAIKTCYEQKKKRGWEKLYFFFDVHATVLRPNYQRGNTPKDFYPYAKEAMQFISNLPDVVCVLYTCSHPNEIEEYMVLFGEAGIKFDYVNENPEVKTEVNGYGCYDKKPYMNVLFEDKAGFDAETEWKEVLEVMKKVYAQESFTEQTDGSHSKTN